MDVISQAIGMLAIVFLIFGIPFFRQRAKERRIRREWRARGLGYAEGKHAVVPQYLRAAPSSEPAPELPVDPAAPVVPVREPTAFAGKWLLAILGTVMGSMVLWMTYQVGTHSANTAGGVNLTTGVQALGKQPDLSYCGGTVASCLQEAECRGMNQGRRPYFGGQIPPQCLESVKRWQNARKRSSKSGPTPH